MKYKIQGSGVYDTETGQSIPNDTSNRHWNIYQIWLTESTGEPPVLNLPDPEFTNTEIDERALADKIQELKAEGLTRIQVEMPAIYNFDTLELVREQWLSIAPAARAPTATFQSIIDIYQAARDGVIVLNGATPAEVTAYDVLTDPTWPV